MTTITEKIEKVVVNIGVGKLRQQSQFDEKVLPEIKGEVARITGAQPSPRPARASIAGFKVREGEIVGLKVTLRRKRMEDFIARLINAVLPRVKDFRGIDPKNIDADGNLNIGLRDQLVFPEIDPNTSKVHFGLQITFVAKDCSREEMIDFYRAIGVPLKP